MAYRESSISTVIPISQSNSRNTLVVTIAASPVVLLCPPNFFRDRPYCFTWSPNHEEHQPVPNVEIRNLSRPGFEPRTFGLAYLCANHEATAALSTSIRLVRCLAYKLSLKCQRRTHRHTVHSKRNGHLIVLEQSSIISIINH